MVTMPFVLRPSLVLLVAAFVAATPLQAQENNRASREREALRRAQQALRSAQEQQSALQREKAALAAERDKLDEAARRNAAQLGSAQAQASRTRGELQRVEAERDRLKTELEELRSASAGREQAWQARQQELETALREARALLAERTQTVTTVRGLLERSTAALADAEGKNGELYAIGRRLLDELRERGAGTGLLGLEQVKLENRAEALRTEIEAQRLLGNTAVR